MPDTLPTLKEAKRYFKRKKYDMDELKMYTDTELRVMAKHQMEREGEYEAKS